MAPKPKKDKAKTHRSFGQRRQLPSGLWKAWYVLDGRTWRPGHTFNTQRMAEDWLNSEWSKRRDPTYRDPSGSKTLRKFVDEDFWPAKRMGLGPRTVETYEGVLEQYVYREVGDGRSAPFSLADMPISKIDDSTIVTWHQACQQLGHTERLAKAWRVLSQVFSLALERRAVSHSPMTIRGAGVEHPVPRTALEPSQVRDLAAAIAPRWRAMVLVSAACGLRYGEALGLQRRDVYLDAERPRLVLRRAIVEVPGKSPQPGPLKARAVGESRTVPLPSRLVPVLRRHLKEFAAPSPDAWVFTMSDGQHPLRAQFAREFRSARDKAFGIGSGVRFHDLRHTAATLWMQSGSTLAEGMEVLGHKSPTMLLRYLHTDETRMSSLAEKAAERLAEAFGAEGEEGEEEEGGEAQSVTP